MTRFPSEDPEGRIKDHIGPAIEVMRKAASQHGLTLHLASDRQAEDDLLGNIGAYMWACKYGVGIVEDRIGRGLNYNAVIEIGAMLITGRRCAILRDKTAPAMPTDLSGQIYKSVNLDVPETVSVATHRWLRDDLALGSCRRCPP
jgi:hypothetical protein